MTASKGPPADGEGHQYEIQLGHLCNNRCVFCSSGQLSERGEAQPMPLGAVIDAIEEAWSGGARRLTFLGGEPTLHPGFVPALRHARRIGFADIVIFTNGSLLPRPGFVDQIAALGDFEWRVSIQGGNEAAHVAVTRRKSSFKRLIEGLELLCEREQRITVNLCASEKNYRSLPELPALISRFGIRQLHVDLVRPHSAGERTRDELLSLIPRYSDMAPYIEEMLRLLEEEATGADFGVGNLPFCILPKWAHRIRHGGMSTVTRASDQAGLEEPIDKYAWQATLGSRLSSCRGCVFQGRCRGVFDTYLELYGEREFVPVTGG